MNSLAFDAIRDSTSQFVCVVAAGNAQNRI